MTQDGNIEETEKNAGTLGDGARILLTLAAAFVVLYGLKHASSVMLPVMMAVFLAIISYSVTVLLRRYLRFPHWLAVIFTVAVDGGVLFGVVSLLRFLAADMTATLQGDVTQRFAEKYHEVMQLLDGWGIGEYARQLASSPQDIFDPQQLIAFSQSVAGQVVSFTSVSAIVLVLMTFILGEVPLFRRNFNRLPNSTEGKYQVLEAVLGVQRYLLIKTVASLCTGALAWWLCAAMNVPFAFLWGVVAYVLNYIPTIGSIVAAVPPVLLALLLGGWGDAFVVAGGYLAINFAIGNGIEPLFLGRQFGISISVVLLSVMLWGWVWGACGMLLAMPITVLIKLALANSRDLSWLATMIEDAPHHKLEGSLEGAGRKSTH